MKAITSIFIILLAVLLCSCSSISTGLYVVPSSHQGLEEMTNDTWRTYGAAPRGAGAPRRDTIEPALGRMRPPVYERHFDEGLRYIIYPTIVRERCLFFGPPLLPLFPVWFLDPQDPEKLTTPYRSRIVWSGDIEKAEEITMYRVSASSRCKGNRRIVSTSKEQQLECEYVFEEKLTDESELLLDYSNGDKIVQIPLMYQRGTEFIPYIRMFDNPKTGNRVSP